MTTMQILFAKSGIITHCDLRRFHQQRAQQPVALFRDGAQLLPSPRTFLARYQSQITRYLLAAWEPAYVAHGEHESQRRVRTDSRLRHQQLRLWMLVRRLLPGLV